ncbi:CsbD family protein [Nodosilinea sp. LEGE 07088]|uniref:CsbD family protein n=1 Tax=Nodosilinea sp. LEGE 07088 TaxID=2777968 RepID=UPI001D14908F|nr:CsbD family protein [Nodosilinea sp. LEGE 07088]
MNIRAIAIQVRRFLTVGLAALVLGSSLLFSFGAPAMALGNEAGDKVQARAEQALDQVAGAGTANQIKGRAQEDIGRLQRSASQAEGIGNQVQGRAQRDLGRTQGAVEDAADAAQDSAEGLVDNVKSFFGQ